MKASTGLILVASALVSSVFGCALDDSVASSLTFDSEGAKNRPVSKVITLLKDMLKQLEKEAEEDEEIYDKMACWCETNDKGKTTAIKEAEARISDLTTSIEEKTAQSARLNTEIKNLNKEVAGNQASLDSATALRQKQLAEFNGEEKDLLESISALKSAVVVLSKHNSMLQVPTSHMLGVAATLQHELSKHSAMLQGVLTPSDRRIVGAFVQSPEDYFDAEPTFKQSYAPQSGAIFGILKQMKETFESNLSVSQKEEMANQKAYEDLKAAKEEDYCRPEPGRQQDAGARRHGREKRAGQARHRGHEVFPLCRRAVPDDAEGEVLNDRFGVGDATEDTAARNGGVF